MLRPQNRYEIKKRCLEINDGKRHKNDSSKCRKLSLLRPGQRVRFQDPITKKWTLTGKVTGFGKTDRDCWVKDDKKARCYRRNRRFIKPIDVEATSPPKQPVQAPAPARTELGNDSCTFADVASQLATPNATPIPPRSAMSGSRPRAGDRIRKKVVRLEAGEEKQKTGKVGRPRNDSKK
jgi:hypothetical protein